MVRTLTYKDIGVFALMSGGRDDDLGENRSKKCTHSAEAPPISQARPFKFWKAHAHINAANCTRSHRRISHRVEPGIHKVL
jgi:hypothetical protein